jgi:hypothetical protein
MMRNVNLFAIILCFVLQACNTTRPRIAISENICNTNQINPQFEKGNDLSSILRNQELASLYFYQQKEEMQNQRQCFMQIISKINE